MKLSEALRLKGLDRARLVSGGRGLERDVRWVHAVEIPEPARGWGPGRSC